MKRQLVLGLVVLLLPAVFAAGCQKDHGIVGPPAQTGPPTDFTLSGMLQLNELPGTQIWLAGSFNGDWRPTYPGYNARTKFGEVGIDGWTILGTYARWVRADGEGYELAYGKEFASGKFQRIEAIEKVGGVELHHYIQTPWQVTKGFTVGRRDGHAVVNPLDNNEARLMDVTLVYTGIAPLEHPELGDPAVSEKTIGLASAWTAFTGMFSVPGTFQPGTPAQWVWHQKVLRPEAGVDTLYFQFGAQDGLKKAGCWIGNVPGNVQMINLNPDNMFILELLSDGTVRNPRPNNDERWFPIEAGGGVH
ncbi:MAG: hypothetical protein WC734_00265 [Patescibacteria group bacterium]|jgi:hypothetical protein